MPIYWSIYGFHWWCMMYEICSHWHQMLLCSKEIRDKFLCLLCKLTSDKTVSNIPYFLAASKEQSTSSCIIYENARQEHQMLNQNTILIVPLSTLLPGMVNGNNWYGGLHLKILHNCLMKFWVTSVKMWHWQQSYKGHTKHFQYLC